MPINFRIENIERDLDEMLMNIEEVDMGAVKERTLRRIAEEMSEAVRQAVFESRIRSPADKISPYEGGDGPPMATSRAWLVEPTGANRYTVFPHPDVRQRAIVLNFGYPGTIKPTNADYLRFTVDGVPMFRKEVEGPEAVGYWESAFRRLEQSGKLEDIAEEELNIEFEEAF